MNSSPGSAMAKTAFLNARLPPAVTTTRASGRTRIRFSRSSFCSSAATSGSMPSTGPSRWSPLDVPKLATDASASGGGPYETMPWPSDTVPGVSAIQRLTIGMTGVWTAAKRRDWPNWPGTVVRVDGW